MEKIDNFAIILDKPDGKYMTGESIVGHLEVKISQRIKVNSIKILLSGEAQVMWTEEGQDYTYTYSGRESLLHSDIVFVAKQGENDLFLEPGDHMYPFNILLPPHIPTSIEHMYGTIRYIIKGTIDIPSVFMKNSLKEAKKPISIVNNLDLNEIQNIRQPYGVSGTKIMCCGPCKSEPIMTYFSINKTGYVSGEELQFNVYLDNKSKNEIKMLAVELVVQLKFRATNDVKICRRTLKTVKYGQKINARENVYWNQVALLIPPINLPSTHRTCIIVVSYFLLLSFKAATITRTFTLAIPIKIGRIPLRSVTGLNMERAYSVMPPTYEKCVEEDEIEANKSNNTNDNNNNTTNNNKKTDVRPTTARPPSYRLFVRSHHPSTRQSGPLDDNNSQLSIDNG